MPVRSVVIPTDKGAREPYFRVLMVRVLISASVQANFCNDAVHSAWRCVTSKYEAFSRVNNWVSKWYWVLSVVSYERAINSYWAPSVSMITSEHCVPIIFPQGGGESGKDSDLTPIPTFPPQGGRGKEAAPTRGRGKEAALSRGRRGGFFYFLRKRKPQ